jgi:hypothetical protein
MKTPSEQLFENFWVANGLLATPIPRGEKPTPDYEVQRSGQPVVFEIKQRDPNGQDVDAIEALHREGAFADYLRNRVREALKDVSPQLKAARQSNKPGVLVVYNNTPFSAGTDPDSVLQAMFGRKQVTVTRKEDGSAVVSEPFLAGNEGLTPTQNTSVSAVCVLRRDDNGSLSLDVFHNPFAVVLLQTDWFAGLPVRQLVVMDDGRFRAVSGSWPELRGHGIVDR